MPHGLRHAAVSREPVTDWAYTKTVVTYHTVTDATAAIPIAKTYVPKSDEESAASTPGFSKPKFSFLMC